VAAPGGGRGLIVSIPIRIVLFSTMCVAERFMLSRVEWRVSVQSGADLRDVPESTRHWTARPTLQVSGHLSLCHQGCTQTAV